MPDPRVPIFKATVADSVGVLLAFGTAIPPPTGSGSFVGAVYIRNAGPDEVFMAWEALPAAASIGDGRFRIRVNEAVNLDGVVLLTLGLLCAALETAVVEAIGMGRPGSSSFGIAG